MSCRYILSPKYSYEVGTLTGEKTEREDLAQLAQPGEDGTGMDLDFWSPWLHDMTYHVGCVLSHSAVYDSLRSHGL